MTPIDDKWRQLPWIGNPKDEWAGSDEGPLPGGRGRVRDFDNGSIYWAPETGAHEVHGDIRLKYAQLGRWIGYPTTDETGCPDGIGRFNHFEHGSIYWTPRTGAHEVHGAIREKWASLGWERSELGYPTSDERDMTGGRVSSFERGEIQWTPQGGAVGQSVDAVRRRLSSTGRRLSRRFVAAGLVDHMHVVVVPILLGRGVRLWYGLEGLESDYEIEFVSAPSGVTRVAFTRAA